MFLGLVVFDLATVSLISELRVWYVEAQYMYGLLHKS